MKELEKKIPEKVLLELKKRGFKDLRPSQKKSIKKGLFENKNLLICTPTGSGKTFVAELAFLKKMFYEDGKTIYVVPLRSLAFEKYYEFKKRYPDFNIGITTGDLDKEENNLINKDLIIMTSEKLDSLLRHNIPWIKRVNLLIIDEIHLLNDISRGPTLEVTITMMRLLNKNIQLIALSATIGNPKELAKWLNAELIIDDWRPVKLEKAIFNGEELIFFENGKKVRKEKLSFKNN